MRDTPALIATVDQAAGVATVTVRGELDPVSCARIQDRLAWVAESGPQRLVLDVTVPACSTEQALTLIATAKERLSPGCRLEIRTASADNKDTTGELGNSGHGRLLARLPRRDNLFA